MLTEKEITRISKFLSLVLRHQPEKIGIELDKNGWVSVSTLLQKCKRAGVEINLSDLQDVVEQNNKKRFAFNEKGDKIRASQGHSVIIDLGYLPQTPPEILFHGTATRSISAIRTQGLVKGSRTHVHLSKDPETATIVGARHGKPFIFEVLAGQMCRDGFEFFQSENGVWLTIMVPAKYLRDRREY